jgi:2-methylcitrate dehydratase PrpD
MPDSAGAASRAPTVAERLAETLCRGTRECEADGSVLHAIERIVLDTLACALGAVDAPPVKAARGWARMVNGEPAARLLGTREASSVLGAALVNCTMARHLDMNDCDWARDPAHPSDNIGACLAVAEVSGAGALDAGFGWLIEDMVHGMGGRSRYDIDARETADHSLPYCVAVALVDGEYTLRQLDEPRWTMPDVKAMLAKVRCVHDPALDGGFPARRPARITVVTCDGSRYEKQVDFPKGDPRDPMTDEDIAAKFRRLSAGVLGAEAQELVIERALDLRSHTLGDLIDACVPRAP